MSAHISKFSPIKILFCSLSTLKIQIQHFDNMYWKFSVIPSGICFCSDFCILSSVVLEFKFCLLGEQPKSVTWGELLTLSCQGKVAFFGKKGVDESVPEGSERVRASQDLCTVQVVPFGLSHYCLNIHSCFLANVWIQFTLRHLPILALNWFPIVITWWLQVIRFPSHLPNMVTETLFLSNLKMKTLVFEWFFYCPEFLSAFRSSHSTLWFCIPHPSRLLHSSTFLPPAPSLAEFIFSGPQCEVIAWLTVHCSIPARMPFSFWDMDVSLVSLKVFDACSLPSSTRFYVTLSWFIYDPTWVKNDCMPVVWTIPRSEKVRRTSEEIMQPHSRPQPQEQSLPPISLCLHLSFRFLIGLA